jgi:hypothetical protein
MEVKKYKYKIVYVFDLICYVMTYPWLAMLSLFVSCYWTTTFERSQKLVKKAIEYAIFGPLLGLFCAMTFPMPVLGYILWIVVCNGKLIRTLILLASGLGFCVARFGARVLRPVFRVFQNKCFELRECFEATKGVQFCCFG